MNKKKKTFNFDLPVLSSRSYSFEDDLNQTWGVDKRYPETAIYKFIQLNKKAFDYLGVTAFEVDKGNKYYLQLVTSKYAGTSTILSPKTGLPVGYISIGGRYGENISELMSVIGKYVQPEFNESIKLTTSNFMRPPIYMECLKFIDLYPNALHCKWRKFVNKQIIEHKPSNSTLWEEYTINSYDPQNTLRYPNQPNILTTKHPEWHQLEYVLNFCIKVIESNRTPIKLRMTMEQKLARLKRSYVVQQIMPVKEISIHSFDPIIIKRLKEIANQILKNSNNIFCAWRIDYAKFFEHYVQYLFDQVSKSRGAHIFCNPRFRIYGQIPSWAIRYLEPDIVLQKGEKQYIVDAKYKTYILNINSGNNTDELKENFRHDLHQVLAYSSFNGAEQKQIMLVCPSENFICKEMNIKSISNEFSCSVKLIGIPLSKEKLKETNSKLQDLITFES